MAKLQPELRALQDGYRDKPDLYLQKMQELYRAHGLTMLDGKGLTYRRCVSGSYELGGQFAPPIVPP